MNSVNKLLSFMLAVIMAFQFLGVGSAATQCSPQTTYDIISITGTGTDDDPWLIGAEKPEDMQAVLAYDALFITGSGKMIDFHDPQTRPWHDSIENINWIGILDDIDSIGENAFMDAGNNVEYVDVFLPEQLAEIGDHAFDGVNFGMYSSQLLPANLVKIGSQAFANIPALSVTLTSAPEISNDAFKDSVVEISYIDNAEWSESNLLQYGGTLSYKRAYAFKYICAFDGEDSSGYGIWYVPEGENLEFNAENLIDTDYYKFVTFEINEGDFHLNDPEDPYISVMLTDNVTVTILYTLK